MQQRKFRAPGAALCIQCTSAGDAELCFLHREHKVGSERQKFSSDTPKHWAWDTLEVLKFCQGMNHWLMVTLGAERSVSEAESSGFPGTRINPSFFCSESFLRCWTKNIYPMHRKLGNVPSMPVKGWEQEDHGSKGNFLLSLVFKPSPNL